MAQFAIWCCSERHSTTDAYVLVLNASYEPLRRVSLRHAITMLVREVAVIEEEAGGTYGPFPRPRVLRLVRYVVARWMHRRTHPCTKSAIKARDRMCAYCGGRAETVDHIVPRSRGGALTWDNAVAACTRCNHLKANRTPAEAGMALLFEPRRPMLADIHPGRVRVAPAPPFDRPVVA